MKLELKHLAPYLPYKLKIHDMNDGLSRVMNMGQGRSNNWVGIKTVERNQKAALGYTIYKPILRPLSDLTKEIEHNGIKFYPIGKLHNSSYRRNGKTCKGEYEITEELRNIITTKKHSFAHGVTIDLNKLDNNESWIINYLLKWHFDVFGLIEEGLAIDINTLKQ